MVVVQKLRNQIFRAAADRRHRTDAGHPEPFPAVDDEGDLRLLYVLNREIAVEEPDERSDRAGRIIVLGLAEEQCGTSFEIAKIDVIAECGADDLALRRDGQDHLRLGIVPVGFGVDADIRTTADRRHRLRLGEDFGVGTDTHFEVLRPKTEFLEQFLDLGGLLRTGDEALEIVAEDGRQPAADLLRTQRIALGLFLDHALQHAVRKGDASRLDGLQIGWREKIARLAREERVERAETRKARGIAQSVRQPVDLEKRRDRCRYRGQVEHLSALDQDRTGSAGGFGPDAPDEHRAGCVGGLNIFGAQRPFETHQKSSAHLVPRRYGPLIVRMSDNEMTCF